MASPEEQAATMRAAIKEKTGKDMATWRRLLAESGLDKHGGLMKLLKGEHGVTHGYANFIVHEFRAESAAAATAKPGGADALVAAQYAKKQDLLPIYDAIMAAVDKLGGDVEVAPKKAYVSLRRKKQFAIVQPSTKTRLDLGLNLKGAEPEGRLEASGSFNAMVSHRVRLTSKKDFDASVKRWLRDAYKSAG